LTTSLRVARISPTRKEANRPMEILAPPANGAPAIEIRIALEATPQVRLVCSSESEERRLDDWIAAQPDLAELVAQALELATARRRNDHAGYDPS
jgi:hypothetical protein